jgi:hypothetical protein
MYKASICELYEDMDSDGNCTGEVRDAGEVAVHQTSTLKELIVELNRLYRMNEFTEFKGRLVATHVENNVLVTTTIYIIKESYKDIPMSKLTQLQYKR